MRERGMTLVEIMVALFIVAIIMTFLMTIYVGTMRVRRRTEQVTDMNTRARAAFELLRRDLQGAFPLADALPGVWGAYSGFERGSEFQWEAGDPSSGFRRLSFMTAVDGARTAVKVKVDDGSGTYVYVDLDPFRHYEHAAISWVVRGGALYRQTCMLRMSVDSVDKPPGWEFNPRPDGTGGLIGTGVDMGEPVYAGGSTTFTALDTYRGMPYIETSEGDATSSAAPRTTMRFEMDNGGTMEPLPVNVVLCFPASRTAPLPGWVDKFRHLETGGVPRTVTAGGVDYELYSRPCSDATVYLGPNEGGPGEMYFVILEPLWWSLGEDAEDLVFRVPTGYSATDADGDGVYTGGVPEYVDVTLTISDPDSPDPLLRTRRFGERIWIPAGGGP